MGKTKITGTQAAILLVVLFVISPITALVSAKIADTLWNLLLAPQYGDGPTYQSWYGISLLSAYVLFGMRSSEPDDGESPYFWAASKLFSGLAHGVLLIFAAYFTALVLGWR